jgi:hypothetical protein
MEWEWLWALPALHHNQSSGFKQNSVQNDHNAYFHPQNGCKRINYSLAKC